MKKNNSIYLVLALTICVITLLLKRFTKIDMPDWLVITLAIIAFGLYIVHFVKYKINKNK